MNARLKLIAPVAVLLVALAASIAFKNNTTAPKVSEVEPIRATGSVDDAAAALNQGAAAEDAIMAESDSDLDVIKTDNDDADNLSGAYKEDEL